MDMTKMKTEKNIKRKRGHYRGSYKNLIKNNILNPNFILREGVSLRPRNPKYKPTISHS